MDDSRLISLSALQHYAYCPRQCALIHNEQVWQDNWLTAQGNLLHQRVDQQKEPEVRKGIRFERGVLVNAPNIGLTGKLDLLEIEQQKNRYTPVEYKKGKPKIENWDRIQLCAQVLCLEEMLSIHIQEAALWYWAVRRREVVVCDEALREETLAVVMKVKSLLRSELTPLQVASVERCQACSLQKLCNPNLIRRDHSTEYIETMYKP